MRERWGLLFMAGTVLLLGAWWWQGRPLSHAPGVLALEEPIQTDPETRNPWTFKGHQITPLARFEICARVLSAERYRFDRASELSPVDFALGWGPMSDSRVLEAFTIQQRDRWYFWSAERLPISASDVITHSANMHMIPATDAVRRRLLSIRVGQVIALRGQLVRADGADGWHWVSSLSRADTGDGSCEVIWVESVTLADR
ncbi:hypothetical protein [Geothrix sp. PMB-07]|uniref:hypothetical protein n=1 Tax=Geothrix sp. PMB-07 TaxID=3068640 RepID=UPI0027404AF7|nr:hypothetical protein [Geothrix sp. PMB-07]WLT29987.1 hypothetical protein Q9293_09695 [Geothrix sp. PMB-07]